MEAAESLCAFAAYTCEIFCDERLSSECSSSSSFIIESRFSQSDGVSLVFAGSRNLWEIQEEDREMELFIHSWPWRRSGIRLGLQAIVLIFLGQLSPNTRLPQLLGNVYRNVRYRAIRVSEFHCLVRFRLLAGLAIFQTL
jgi:hypothetical protein